MRKKNALQLLPGLDPRRSFRTLLFCACVLLLVAILLLQLLLGALPKNLRRFDLTGRTTFALDETSKEYLSSHRAPVTLYVLNEGGARTLDEDLCGFYEDIAEIGQGITLQVIDTRTNPDFARSYGIEHPADGTVIVQGASRHRVIEATELYYYFNTLLGVPLYAEEYNAAIGAYTSGDTTHELYATGQLLVQTAAYNVPYFDGNELLINALVYVSAERIPRIGVYRGSGCQSPDASFARELSLYCYDLYEIERVEELPEECELLMLYAPAEDLSETEAAALKTHLDGGGDLWLFTLYNKTNLPRLNALLATYGMSPLGEGQLVCEATKAYAYSVPNASTSAGTGIGAKEYHEFIYRLHINNANIASLGVTEAVATQLTHGILCDQTTFDGSEHNYVKPIFQTSRDKGYLSTPEKLSEGIAGAEERGQFCVAATAQKGDSSIFWAGSPFMLDATINEFVSGGNYEFFRGLILRMTGEEGRTVEIKARALPTTVLSVKDTGFVLWGAVLVLLIPGGVLAAGWIRRTVRKRK